MKPSNTIIPANERQALQWLIPALDRPLHDMPHKELMQAWSAVFFLYGGLHPDGCDDHGEETSTEQDGPEHIALIEPRLITPYYTRSGWPVVLAPLALEVCRRFEQNLMNEEEYYPSDAQYAGICARIVQD
jgi:hypothetical protein